MSKKRFTTKRSTKLLLLFLVMTLFMLVFLDRVSKILISKRELPSHTSVIHDRALRGAIISADNYTISRSNKSYTATVYAQSIEPKKWYLFVRLFSIYSGIDEAEVIKAFYDKNGNYKRGYITLSKNIDASTAIYLKSLARKLRGLRVFKTIVNSRGNAVLYGLDIIENGEIREFPLKDTLTPVIGYIRNKIIDRYSRVFGVKGLEKRYEKYLTKSQDGLIKGMRDVGGNVIYNKSAIEIKRRDGYNLHLNISIALQKYIEHSLDLMKEEVGAKEIIAGVMDSSNGKLLALASSERFNPANITQDDIPKLNPKFTEYLYEPGSVIKPLTLSLALDKGLVTPNTVFPTYNGGPFHISKRNTIRDDEKFESLSATDIIVHSSNIGISQISWLLSGKEFRDGLSAFGLGKPSGVDLTRDLAGKIKSLKLLNNKLHRANQAYGYGMQVTFMQLLKAYSVFNNGGVIVTPHLIDALESSNGYKFSLNKKLFPSYRVLKDSTAKKMQDILRAVVERGTGVATKYPGLDIGGKTGTAHIARGGHYVRHYNSSFFGFANDDKGHRYTIGVLVIDATKPGKYFASLSAVPTFKKIVDTLVELNYLKPYLSPKQAKEMEKRRKERLESIHKKQINRAKRTKERLRREREKIERKRRKKRIYRAINPFKLYHPKIKHHIPKFTYKISKPPLKPIATPPKKHSTPHEALPDMF